MNTAMLSLFNSLCTWRVKLIRCYTVHKYSWVRYSEDTFGCVCLYVHLNVKASLVYDLTSGMKSRRSRDHHQHLMRAISGLALDSWRVIFIVTFITPLFRFTCF